MTMAGEDQREPPLRLVCSDELGQLKVVQTVDGTQLGTAALASTWGQPDKLQWVDCIALGSLGGIGDTASAVLAVSRRSGSIELLSPLTGTLLGSIDPAPTTIQGIGSSKQQQEDAVRVRGLHLLWHDGSSGINGNESSAESPLSSVLSVTEGGTVRVHTPAAGCRGTWEQQLSWQVPADVCCTAYDAASGRLAVGCKGAELRLFDCATGELVFAFKGGKPNMVGLVDLPWNTAILFLPPLSNGDSSSEADASSGDRLLVGTGYQKVRLYDKSKGKRPQMELTWGEGRVTCMAMEPSGNRVWLGNGMGKLEVLDVPGRRFTGAIRGLAGGVRALAVHPTLPVLASVGLDRYLRLHDTESRHMLAKVYCKTLPTGLALCPTDASMLPAIEQQQEQKQKQRRRRGAASSEEEEEESDAEEEEVGGEQDAAAQRKRSRSRGAGGSKRQRDNRRRQVEAGGN